MNDFSHTPGQPGQHFVPQPSHQPGQHPAQHPVAHPVAHPVQHPAQHALPPSPGQGNWTGTAATPIDLSEVARAIGAARATQSHPRFGAGSHVAAVINVVTRRSRKGVPLLIFEFQVVASSQPHQDPAGATRAILFSLTEEWQFALAKKLIAALLDMEPSAVMEQHVQAALVPQPSLDGKSGLHGRVVKLTLYWKANRDGVMRLRTDHAPFRDGDAYPVAEHPLAPPAAPNPAPPAAPNPGPPRAPATQQFQHLVR